jgi:nitrogen PTS system EIIA component
MESQMKLGVKSAAQLLNVSQKSIYRWIKQSAIPAYQVSDRYRFDRAELLEWARSRRIGVSPDIFSESKEGVITLAEALAAGGIHYRVGGGDRDSVLRHAVDLMNLPVEVDREYLHRMLLSREELCSSALGDGIAAPHPPSPMAPNLDSAMAALCFLDRPVDWHAADGHGVRAIFVLLSPTLRDHLRLLSQLGFALRNGDFKNAVTSQAGRDELLGALNSRESVTQSFEHLD